MKHDPIASGKRKAVNLSLDTGIVAFAREHGVSLSKTCEAALRQAGRNEEARRWKEENKAAFDYWNEWVAEHGLPLEKYRLF